MSVIKYRPAIDGLRAIAVVSVLLFHLEKTWLPGGFVGVDVFFVISGYLITSILVKQLDVRSFSIVDFYQRRIARIFPAFFAVTIFTLIVSKYLYSPQDYASAGSVAAASNLFAANIKFMMQGDYFALSPDAQPFLHYWSLAIEEQFYFVFPLLLLLFYRLRFSKQKILWSVLALLVLSFCGCVFLTVVKPVWAFYLLPTRAWEILAGCALALHWAIQPTPKSSRLSNFFSNTGLLIILVSIIALSETQSFPGFIASLPVLGVVLFLCSHGQTNSFSERALSVKPLIVVGRLSYSLYLWHWPIFSFVDYGLYASSGAFRLMTKVSLTLLTSVLSYYFLENPARYYLNQPKKKLFSFSVAASIAVMLIFAGTSIRSSNYVTATLDTVDQGGIVINKDVETSSIILMGDSNASMYATTVKDIAENMNMRANVLSVTGEDPMPDTPLWEKSFSLVQKERPKIIIIAASWMEKLSQDRDKIKLAVEQLEGYSDYIFLITQPPVLPETANREHIRRFGLAPIKEDPVTKLHRREVNNFLKTLISSNVVVLDVESQFTKTNGEILFADQSGKQLYHDAAHLSGYGSDKVRTMLMSEITDRIENVSTSDKSRS